MNSNSKSFQIIAMILVCLAMFLSSVNTARILMVAPFFAKSHAKVINAVTLNLAKRDHDVTVITSNVIKDPPPNIHQIPVDFTNYLEQLSKHTIGFKRSFSVLDKLIMPWNETFRVHDIVFESQEVVDFLENDKTHFDAVIVEMLFEEVMYHFAHKYQAPLILLETSSLRRSAEDAMGNPLHSSYVPIDSFHYAGELSFWNRLFNWLAHTVEYLGRTYYYNPRCDEFVKKYYKTLPKPVPSVEDMVRNVSLILVNTHYSIDTVMPLVPGIVQIGGIHIEPPKQLPKKIKDFIDGAKHGVVVFTMGTHVEISTMDEERVNAIIKVFKSLKQRVIMKWENDNPPVADNVMTMKFVPQIDILAYGNVKAFITHGGMLGVQEAISYGIPIVGIPIIADQLLNVARLVHLGAAVEVDYLELNEKTVMHAMNEIINNPKYRQMAKELSRRFNERPMGPVDTAMYWIEYVIKFKGTPFLKSPLTHMPWYKYRMIDVAAFFVILLIIFIYGLCLFWKMLCNCLHRWHQKSAKLKKKKRT